MACCPLLLSGCRVYQALQRFAVLDLSNFYLDVAKDRLYIRAAGAPDRRACQTVLAALLEVRPRVGCAGRQKLPYCEAAAAGAKKPLPPPPS